MNPQGAPVQKTLDMDTTKSWPIFENAKKVGWNERNENFILIIVRLWISTTRILVVTANILLLVFIDEHLK